jgi:protein TonB
MPIAVAAAIGVHALLISSIGLHPPEWDQRQGKSLELMVITQPAAAPSAPVTAVVAAQADRGGETQAPLPELDEPSSAVVESQALEGVEQPLQPTDQPVEPSPQTDTTDASVAEQPADAPLEPLPEPPPVPEQPPLEAVPPPLVASAAPVQSAQPAPLAASAELDTEPASIKAVDATPPRLPPPDLEEPRTISAADIFASRNAEMASLTARIQAESSAYASRARRKAISTATREYIYANYMEAWRRKVERIGNLNYPREARELGLFGSLILHVAVRADGSLEGIRVVRSSGHEVLDDAAIRIVELAAPFSPFPPNIKRETDVLDITRTWQFQRNNQLGWDN